MGTAVVETTITDLEERVIVKTNEGIHTPAKRRGRKSLLNTSVQ
jgi:hypothetical protein